MFKFVGEYGQAGLIDEISRFILENWPQQQDWILAKLQEDAGIQGIEAEEHEIEFEFTSKQMLQINWLFEDAYGQCSAAKQCKYGSWCWFEDLKKTPSYACCWKTSGVIGP